MFAPEAILRFNVPLKERHRQAKEEDKSHDVRDEGNDEIELAVVEVILLEQFHPDVHLEGDDRRHHQKRHEAPENEAVHQPREDVPVKLFDVAPDYFRPFEDTTREFVDPLEGVFAPSSVPFDATIEAVEEEHDGHDREEVENQLTGVADLPERLP